MIKFYYHPSPNPDKIALYLEEPGLDYALKSKHTFKTEMDDDARRHMFPQNAARG
ncbi:MAG TPA: hypothetical protein VFJ08_05750 [Salinisphaera sp.]|nr:hypothetical protein [Salinisphaera sp.]HET7313836.1 hypothetical protein [Salinisphaera sp.]